MKKFRIEAECPECGAHALDATIKYVKKLNFKTYFIEATCDNCGMIHRTGDW